MKNILGLILLPFALVIIVILLIWAQVKYFIGWENEI